MMVLECQASLSPRQECLMSRSGLLSETGILYTALANTEEEEGARMWGKVCWGWGCLRWMAGWWVSLRGRSERGGGSGVQY